MEKDIGTIVSECLNNPNIQRYLIESNKVNFLDQRNNFSRMIGYCILFKESEGLEEYMSINKKDDQIEFIKKKVADKLEIPHSEINNRIKEIKRYTFENFIRKGYMFHAGNSKEINNLMKNGIKEETNTQEEKEEFTNLKNYFSYNKIKFKTINIIIIICL